MEKKQSSSNSWSEFETLAIKGHLGETAAKIAVVKFIDDIKSIISEFQITDFQFFKKNILNIKEMVTEMESSKFQNTAPRKKDVSLIRKKSFSVYLNYLRTKMGWPAIKYNPKSNLSIYFNAPPTIATPIKQLDPEKSNLIEFESMMLDGTLGKKHSKGVTSSYLTYINNALLSNSVKRSQFQDLKIKDIETIISKLNLKHKGDTSDSKSALNKYVEYLRHKSTLPEVIVKGVKRKPSVSGGSSKHDHSLYTFQGKQHKKSRILLVVMKRYVDDHKPKLSELKVAFPKNIITHNALFREQLEAQRINDKDGTIRYFTKPGELLKLGDGTAIAVTSQVTLDKVESFIQLAAKHNYIVEKYNPVKKSF